jgi:protein involved in polysaccharide export with SLBB domain
MVMTKVGQIWGRFCIASCLLLTGLFFAGCQTERADSGFSEVPGIEPVAQVGTSPSNTAATPAVAPNTTPTATTNLSPEIIKVGDILLITFGDLPTERPLPAFDQRVKEDGTITLIYNQVFQAVGKRTGDLEKEIRAFYVPAYFRNLTVTVRISTETRFFYVEGEVRLQGKLPYTGPITVTKAIAAAGGFTDFANKRSVKLIRADGRKQTINCNKVLVHPELDPTVFPDDKIHVPRRIF